MKTPSFAALLLMLTHSLFSQNTTNTDTIVPEKGNSGKQLAQIKEKKLERHSDSTGNEPMKSALIDTTIQNKYGDLLNEDSAFNKRYPLWKPTVQTFVAIALTWSFDRYLHIAAYARIGITSWKYNLKNGWEWDNDCFGVNFVGHPHSEHSRITLRDPTGITSVNLFLLL